MQLDQINQMAAQINIVIKDMELFYVDVDITFEELLHQIGERLSPYSDQSQIIQEDLMRTGAGVLADLCGVWLCAPAYQNKRRDAPGICRVHAGGKCGI